ncbi:MAG: hypothetical protein DRN04_05005 [Thermoprotei archaeon]|nr:MAG: hypothetical protein DRN04_05005 [Thermoprotei archaeon]
MVSHYELKQKFLNHPYIRRLYEEVYNKYLKNASDLNKLEEIAEKFYNKEGELLHKIKVELQNGVGLKKYIDLLRDFALALVLRDYLGCFKEVHEGKSGILYLAEKQFVAKMRELRLDYDEIFDIIKYAMHPCLPYEMGIEKNCHLEKMLELFDEKRKKAIENCVKCLQKIAVLNSMDETREKEIREIISIVLRKKLYLLTAYLLLYITRPKVDHVI